MTNLISCSCLENRKVLKYFNCACHQVQFLRLPFFYESNHRRRKYERCSPNSLRPISYFGSIWELHVLDLKTRVFCRKKNSYIFLWKGTHSAKKVLIVQPKILQMPQKSSAQFVCPSPKVSNF